MGAFRKIYFMRSFFMAILVAFGFLIIQSCNSNPTVSEHINRQWMLIEFQNFSRELMVKNRANMDLATTKSGPNQYGASMGCNRMFFTAKFNGKGVVKFSDVGSTMMYCDQNMDLESAFAKSLPTITKYKIEGHHLTLTNDKGEIMKFVASDWD